MNSLEDRLRNALVEVRTEEIYDELQSSRIVERMGPIFRELGTNMLSYLFKNFGDDLDADDMCEMKNAFETQMDQSFGSVNLRDMARSSAENEYITFEELERKVTEQTGKVLGPEDREKVNYILEDVSYLFENRRKVFEGLVRIAEEEGIETAVTKEARYRVIREVFPTPEEYRKYYLGGMEIFSGVFKKARVQLMCGDEEEQGIADMIGNVGEIFENFGAEIERIISGDREKSIREIYGSDSEDKK